MENNHFFLGTSSPEGFFSLFGELYNPTGGGVCYILKGGPGTGKSTFMRRVGESAENCGLNVEYINCASDPTSLDAVIIKEKNVCIVDGTAPHVVEPVYAGACEQIIDLGEYWDKAMLYKNRENIFALNAEYRLSHANAVRFLKGAAVLNEDTARIYERFTDNEKILAYAERTARREAEKISGVTGICKKRLISAITPIGIFCHTQTIKNMCNRIIGIEGNIGVSSKIIKSITDCMMKKGHNVILCPSFYNPNKDYVCLIVPDEKLCFIYTGVLPKDINTDKLIHTSRFTDNISLSDCKNRIKFNKRLCDELTLQAINSLANAKYLHDNLEKLYMPAMNYKKCEKRCDSVLREILNK